MKYYKFDKTEERNCPVKIFASEEIYNQLEETAIEQLLNASKLRGAKGVIGLPDLHQGYGLPIGGVLVTDTKTGVVSPGAVGFDINCGVRLLKSKLTYQKIEKKLGKIINTLKNKIPAGLGSKAALHFDQAQFKKIVEGGVPFLINNLGFGDPEDIHACEAKGHFPQARASKVSAQAKKRGQKQLGTLGSGNHFIEIQRVETIFTPTSKLKEDQLCIMVHTGSRGFGHQIAKEYINQAKEKQQKHNLKPPNKNLASFPAQSKDAQNYQEAMYCAANFAFANRQLITHHLRQELWNFDINLKLVADLAHNIVKEEMHPIDGENQKVFVHRKGATSSNKDGLALIPGSMGTSSYLVKAKKGEAFTESFHSLAHGAGRKMSRRQAKKTISQEQHKKSLQGVEVVSGSNSSLLDESPGAYKNINTVISSLQKTELALPVAKLKPLAVLKG